MQHAVRFRNGRVAKNGFAVAALTNSQSNKDGTLHERELSWLSRRAQGGYGIVFTCASHVQTRGQGWRGEIGCFSDMHIPGLRRLSTELHRHGALALVQLFHGGMRADETLFQNKDDEVVSCVDTIYKHRNGSRHARSMSEAEIYALADDFASAAHRCELAGCDGVEIHGAHGYVLTQFLCPDLNTRNDQWGGSLENRARFTREVVRRIRSRVSSDFVVGVRLSPEPGFERAGWNMDPDEQVQVARWLCDDGVEFVSVSLFAHCPTHITSKHQDTLPNPKPLAQVFREACPADVVVMACGGIATASDCKALAELGVDVAVTGSTAIGNPDFPIQVTKDDTFEALRPPFTQDHLEAIGTSSIFIDVLRAMRLVERERRQERSKL